MWHDCKLTRASNSGKYCICYLVAQAAPYPGPTGKVRALTPLAVDWFRGVPHSRRVATVCLEVSNTRSWSGFDLVAYSGSLF